MKKIFLHIGMHKTGTSSIQSTLFHSTELLKKYNVFYPTSLGENHSIPLYSNFCENPSRYYLHVKNGLSQKEVEHFNESYINSFMAELKQNYDIERLVLSGEDVSSLTELDLIKLRKFLRKELNNYELKIICFVRNPWSYFTSSTQEYLKVGHNKPAIPTSIYKTCLEKFITVFGRDSISVYSFEKACNAEYGIVGEFLKIIGLDYNVINQIPIKRVNESLSHQAVEIIEYINRTVPFFKNAKIAKGRTNRDLSPLYQISGDRYLLSAEEYSILTKNIHKDLEWLEAKFNIVYSQKDIIDNDIQIIYGEKYFRDLKKVYPQLTKTLKILVYHFMLKKLSQLKTTENKNIFERIIEFIQTEFTDITRIDFKLFMNEMVHFQNFKLALNIDRPDAEIYRDLAVFLECNGHYEAAYFYMNRALELRPGGPFIKERFEFLKEIKDKNTELKKSSS